MLRPPSPLSSPSKEGEAMFWNWNETDHHSESLNLKTLNF